LPGTGVIVSVHGLHPCERRGELRGGGHRVAATMQEFGALLTHPQRPWMRGA
jgi:hypothetical protein